MLLRDEGYTVTPVADGQLAVDAAACDDFCIAVLDVAMPHMSGLAAAALLRASHPRLRIAFHTALEETVVRRTFPSCDGYFRKPLDLPRMLSALSGWRRGAVAP